MRPTNRLIFPRTRILLLYKCFSLNSESYANMNLYSCLRIVIHFTIDELELLNRGIDMIDPYLHECTYSVTESILDY